eukprot:TRINITY_DN16523_c0_g1_i1.p1 TRINITY_DN16523_c0_g1~~TRINITY_DN16523_c0_g1_i1.p1  ORF type:complete len:242 (+),score=115.92 TRINITY_DN16523_c0_g1_i1:78-728(+)
MEDQKREQLRRERATLENDVEQKLLTLCRMEGPADPEAGDGGLAALERDVEHALGALGRVNDALLALEGSTPGERQQNAHHADIMQGFARDFRVTKGKLRAQRARAELLPSCRQEIREFNAAHAGAQALGHERDTLGKAAAVAQAIAATAQSSRERLAAQRATFAGILDRSGELMRRLPMVDGIIGKIQKKKSRDMLVLGLIIGLCLFLVWLYWKD